MKIINGLITLCFIVVMYSCSSDDTASITPTITVSNVERYNVVIDGVIPIGDNTEIEECGIYWSQTNTKPTDMDKRVIVEQENGKFQVKLTNLKGATTYYVRGYAKSRTVTDVSETIQFTTTKGAPEIGAYISIGDLCIVKGDIGGGEVKEVGYCRILATHGNENVIPSIEHCDDRIRIEKKILKNQSSTKLFEHRLGGEYLRRYHACVYIITTEGIGYSKKVTYTMSVR